MKELKIVVEINAEIEDGEDSEKIYNNILNELDSCGYDSGFSFKVLDKEIK